MPLFNVHFFTFIMYVLQKFSFLKCKEDESSSVLGKKGQLVNKTTSIPLINLFF